MSGQHEPGGRASPPRWFLDELGSIGSENIDPVHVAQYDEKEDADAATEVRLLQAAGMGTSAVLVDLGAGTGQFALAAAEVCGRVVAVDPSPVMREQLLEHARRDGSTVEIVDAGFLTYAHIGRPPDVIYSRFALHHLPDFWKVIALARIRAMLPPGGLFRLSDVVFHFPPSEVEERIERWCASLPEQAPAGQWVREDIEVHMREEHSTFTWLLEPMLAEAGFSIQAVDYSEDGFFAKYLMVAS